MGKVIVKELSLF